MLEVVRGKLSRIITATVCNPKKWNRLVKLIPSVLLADCLADSYSKQGADTENYQSSDDIVFLYFEFSDFGFEFHDGFAYLLESWSFISLTHFYMSPKKIRR